MTLTALALLSITIKPSFFFFFFNPQYGPLKFCLLYKIVKTNFSFQIFEFNWDILLTMITCGYKCTDNISTLVCQIHLYVISFRYSCQF